MSGQALDTALSFDFGLKRIGVAVGSRLSGGGQPLKVIVADDDARRFEAIGALIAEWQPALLVVGRPQHPDGAPLPVTARCEKFARQLNGRFGLPVNLVDESYSSLAAGENLRQSGRRGRAGAPDDAEAAAIILRQYWSESDPT